VLQDLIKTRIISNGHRVTVTSLPDTQLEAKARLANASVYLIY
jgi:Zn-dependent M16 (insulinase) family peptidase